MKFSEVAVDTAKIKSKFEGTPVIDLLPELRKDFEKFNEDIIEEDVSGLTPNNKMSDLVYYKTELFDAYCKGMLSVLISSSSVSVAIKSKLEGDKGKVRVRP